MKALRDIIVGIVMFGVQSVYAAPALDQTTLNHFNADLKTMFSRGEQKAKEYIVNSINETIQGNKNLVDNQWVRIRITSWGTPSISGLSNAPGLFVDSNGKLTAKIPSSGGWGVKIPNVNIEKVDYAYVWPFGSIPVGYSYFVTTLALTNIKLEQGLRITGSDNGSIDIDSVSDPNFNIGLSITGPNIDGLEKLVYVNISNSLSDLLLENFAPQAYFLDDRLLPDFAAGLKRAANRSITPIGGTVTYPITPFTPDLEGIIKTIDRKVRYHNMLDGIVHEVYVDKASQNSWAEAYRPNSFWQALFLLDPNGGSGKYGQAPTTDDSAIWTGTYLAALAYRYSVMRDAETLGFVSHVLTGIEALYAAHSDSSGQPTGLLARSAASAASTMAKTAANSASDNACIWASSSGVISTTRHYHIKYL